MNYELSLGVPAIAVGLSAISFSATLQKDAAPIPNAKRRLTIKRTSINSMYKVTLSNTPWNVLFSLAENAKTRRVFVYHLFANFANFAWDFNCPNPINTASAVNIGFRDFVCQRSTDNGQQTLSMVSFAVIWPLTADCSQLINTASAVNIGFSRLRLSTDNSQRSTDLDVQNFTTLNLKL